MTCGFGNRVAVFSPGRLRYDFTSHSFDLAARHAAVLAVQPGMGLLPKRRTRHDPADRPRPGLTRTRLRVAAPCARISPPPVLLSGLPQPAGVAARRWKLARGAS